MTPVIAARASAKINLHLGVGGLRPDGFHELHTVYQAVSIQDEIVARPFIGWTLRTNCHEYVDPSALPAPKDNIITRAGRLLADLHGIPAHAELVVEKAIPVAGGLAGGSADAATALVVLDRLWGLGTPRDELLRLAAELGSDVPFALLGGTGLGTGHGEVVEPVPDPGEWWWVVVPSRVGMSTPAVYRHFDELNPGADPLPPTAEALVGALATRDPHALAPTLLNGLQEPAFALRPALRALVARGESAGALRGLVSGSGPTCVFLCESGPHARAVADSLRATDPPTANPPTANPPTATPPLTALVASGPAPGASLVHP